MSRGKAETGLELHPPQEKQLYPRCVSLCVYLFCFSKMEINIYSLKSWASLVAQLVKNPPAMQETLVGSLVWEDPPEDAMATHSSILAWRIPMDRGAWRAAVHEVTKSWTRLSD